MAITFSICAVARLLLGKTIHPVEDDAQKKSSRKGEQEFGSAPSDRSADKGIEEEKLDSFVVLGVSGHWLAEVAILLGMCKLPVAFSIVEALHCLAIVVIVQLEMISTRLLCTLTASIIPEPFAEIAKAPWRPFLLLPNIADWCKSHGFVAFVYYVWSISWYETYVNMLLAGPFTSCGWPLAASAVAVGISTGLLNHSTVNGLQNGILATVFYLTMAVMFSVSGSILTVTAAHSIFYFRQLHSSATCAAFGHPLFVLILLTNTAFMFVLLSGLSRVLPLALPFLAPQDAVEFSGKSLSISWLYTAFSFSFDCIRFGILVRRFLIRSGTPDAAGGAYSKLGDAECSSGSA